MEQGRKRLLSSSCKDINDLPLEIIGVILSHLSCVRDVAMASMTCWKLRYAVKHHLNKITCHFPLLDTCKWKNYEHIINGVIMQTSCLRDLAIYDGRIRAGLLSVWLLHTRKTLRSFTFLSTTRTRSILEKLARVGVNLECLVWGYANVPTLNITTCSLPSLKSLTIHKVVRGFDTVEHIQLLFALFPKLETLSLTEILIRNAPPRVVLNISSTLKTLSMKRLWFDHVHLEDPKDTTLVVSAYNLSCLSLISLSSNNKELMWVELEQEKSLRDLIVQDVNILRLRLGDSLEHLVIWNAHIKHLEVKHLGLLLDLKLFMDEEARAIWPTYLKIIGKASTKLSKLQLLGGLPTFTADDLDRIASLFPRLRWLSLYHQNTLFGKPPRKLRAFRQLFDLELYVNNKVTNHDLFGGWILKFLECCPNMKRLFIKLEPRPAISWAEEIEFPRKLATLLKGLARPYPHVDVRFDTVDTKEILRIFSRNYLERHIDPSSLVFAF